MNILFVLILFFGAQELCEKLLGFQNLAVYMEKYEPEKIFKKIIEEGIYNLRGPQDDGSFKYAYLSMENPETLNFSFELEKFPFNWKKSEENIFSIEIHIPKKKNIFWGNEDAYLKEWILKFDGVEKVIEKSLIELKKAVFGSTYFNENLNYCLENCRNSFKRELLFILYLLKGNHNEQLEGIKRLEKLLNQIK